MKKRKLLSIVLSLCMVLALMPQMVFADPVTNITYLDASGASQTCESATVVTSSDTEWTGTAENPGWYVAQGEVTISSRVTVNGDVHLILADGCKLTVNGGIGVNYGNNLTIYGQENGTGELKAYAANGTNYAGIGGDNSYHNIMGVITINGGNITAVGDGAGSGIGGGIDGAFGSITINGGTVTATGGRSSDDSSSGIGAFHAAQTIGNITISGGTVTAIGGCYGINASSDGTISTGANGHAVIFASYTDSWGSDFYMKNDKASWSGVIFEGDSGQIYGSSVTPTESFEIPAGKTLTIESGKTLIIPDGVILTNNGTINDTEDNGKICVEGEGTLKNNGKCTCLIFYHLTLTNCEVLFNNYQMVKHDEKIYVEPDGEVGLKPNTPPEGYVFDRWEVSPAGVTIEDNGFTMPAAALTVTAKWVCTHSKGLIHTPEVPSTYTEYGVKEYWTCSTCNMNFSDADGKTEITDLESWKADAGRIAKLPPEIIKGKGQTITAGEKKALSFTSNADYNDFLRVELDGKTLDAKNYTVESGSTIVTLNADFVAALPAGEHTIGIVSANGTATTTFIIKEKPAADNSSDTGDSTSLPLLIGLMFLSIAGITGMTGYRRRKRADE